MYIFVDESGTHKAVDHSTFCLVYITMEEREKVERSVVEIEQRLRVPPFHWVNQPWRIREAFLREVNTLPFAVKVAIFRNPIAPRSALEWALLHTLIEKSFREVCIDGKEPRWVERQLKKVLRDKGISVKKLKTVRHSGSPGIRLADAFAGLTRMYHDDPTGKAKKLWEIVRQKVTTQLTGGQVDG